MYGRSEGAVEGVKVEPGLVEQLVTAEDSELVRVYERGSAGGSEGGEGDNMRRDSSTVFTDAREMTRRRWTGVVVGARRAMG